MIFECTHSDIKSGTSEKNTWGIGPSFPFPKDAIDADVPFLINTEMEIVKLLLQLNLHVWKAASKWHETT